MTGRGGVLPHVFTSSVFFTLAFFGLFGFSSDASAAVKNYIGPNSGGWNTAANWSPIGVPSAADDVFISSSTASIEVQLPVSQTASFKSLTISTSTATITVDGGVNIAR